MRVPKGHQRELYGRLPAQVRCSELELEGELDGAGAADLVEGVEAAKGAPPEPRLLASVCVECPNQGSVRSLLGLLKFGWLKMLKNSDRKRSPIFSVR